MQQGTELDVAVAAARAGGQVAQAYVGNPLYFRWKGQRDLLAGASLLVQQAILDTLQRAFPEDGLLAEEGDEDEPLPVYADRLWVVDPICGSINFFQGIPFFGVSVAFRRAGRYEVGVVYDPIRDELFQARLGGGARLNDEAIVVQQVAEGHEAYERAVVGTDWPGGASRRTEALMLAGLLASEVVTVSALGSPALGLCYVAAGRLHAYCHLDLKLWDVAAAALIVQEAGGSMTDARGGAWQHSDGGFLGTNGTIHGSILRNMSAVLQQRDPFPEGATTSRPPRPFSEDV